MKCNKDFTSKFWGEIFWKYSGLYSEILLMWHFPSNLLTGKPNNGEVKSLIVGEHFTVQFHCTPCIQMSRHGLFAWDWMFKNSKGQCKK